MNTNAHGTPTLVPPQLEATMEADVTGTTAPRPVTDAEIVALLTESTTPTLTPPRPGETAAAEAVAATWRNSVKIDALWTIDETRNAFVRVAGLGWRKLYNGRDGAFLALVTLASQARQTGRTVNLREEADGMIYEIYLW
jgi:hypothetical protein